MRLLLSFIFCLSTSTGLFASSTDLVSEILSQNQPADVQRPHLVYDIDDILCVRGQNFSKHHEEVLRRLPNAIIVPFYHSEEGLSDHLFLPNYGEAFLNLLSWGWNIDFFSSGVKERNEMVIPAFIKHALTPYCQNPDSQIPELLKRMRIFSRDHLINNNDLPEDENRKFEIGGGKKKDLRSLNVPLDQSILIDDDRTYALGGEQYPFFDGAMLRHCRRFYEELNQGKECTGYCLLDFSPKSEFTPGQYPHADYAAFQLGVLLDCKKLMDDRGINLRPALKIVLETNKPQHEKEKYGPCAIFGSDLDNQTNWPRLSNWINCGRKAIQETITKRRQDNNSVDVYKSIALEYYQTTEFEKNNNNDCAIM